MCSDCYIFTTFPLHNFNGNICSLRDCTAAALTIVWPSHCCSMLVRRVGWSYWAGAGHEVARPPGCTAALVWAAPPTPHNLLSIIFSIQSGTCLYKNIYIYLLSTDYIKADPLSSYHVNIFVKTICLRARYIFGCNTSRLSPNDDDWWFYQITILFFSIFAWIHHFV